VNNRELEKKVKTVAGQLVSEKGYASSVDVLIKLGYLTQKDYENWRMKKVDYLERVCKVNLKKLSLVNKTLRAFGYQAKLKPSKTVYISWGKGPKQRLRFSKSANPRVEEWYATHWVLSKKKHVVKKEKE